MLKFYSLTTADTDVNSLEPEYKNAREIGIIRLGESCLFFRKRLKVYYITYKEITRCFRRVMTVPAKLCCGKGEFAIEHLVIYAGENEVAQIQLPGTKAAKILMEELKQLVPDAQFSRPDDTQDTAKENDK